MTTESRELVDRRTALLMSGAAAVGVALVTPQDAAASNFPRLDKALEQMKDAKDYLENAKSLFGGHKRKAVNALTTAISEIEMAIAKG